MSESKPSSPAGRRGPVPMPFSVRLKEFRTSLLPTCTFICAATAVVFLWKSAGLSTGIQGIGEGARSIVTLPQPAIIQRILVEPYQLVNAGDAIAVVQVVEPRAALDLLQMELGLARLEMQPSIAEGNAMNFEQIRVDLLRTRSELGIARVNLARSENQVRRNEPLYREKLVSEDIYDISVKTREMYLVEVIEKSNAVAQIEKRLDELKVLGVPQGADTDSPDPSDLSRLQELRAALATNWGPMTVYAPISGMVSSVTRHQGESVVEGEPFITISAPVSDRVVGYLRQPYPVQPSIGQEVVMVTRERKPRRLIGTVKQIGAQVEMITNSLAFIKTGSLVDAGLPVIVSIPPGLSIRPGEVLDLNFRTVRTPPDTTVESAALANPHNKEISIP